MSNYIFDKNKILKNIKIDGRTYCSICILKNICFYPCHRIMDELIIYKIKEILYVLKQPIMINCIYCDSKLEQAPNNSVKICKNCNIYFNYNGRGYVIQLFLDRKTEFFIDDSFKKLTVTKVFNSTEILPGVSIKLPNDLC